MLQLCSYETHALGYSAFCNLFSEGDFLNYEYFFDLVSSPPPVSPISNLDIKQHAPPFSHSITTTVLDLQSLLPKEKAISKNGLPASRTPSQAHHQL